MNDLITIRTPEVIAAEINGIKSQTRAVLLCSSIEIGRRLVEAKALLQHGEWGGWLETAVDYSQRTAQNLMKIFEEYGADSIPLFGDNAKAQAFADLTYSQAVALLGVPAEEREAFAQENDVASKSTRELQQMIRERDEALAKLTAAEKGMEEADNARETLAKVLAEERLKAKTKIDQLTSQLTEAKAAGASQEKLDELTGALNEAQEKIKQLTEQLSAPVTMDAAVVEKIPEDVERELAELREKVKAGQQKTASAAIVKYGVCFDQLVAGFKNLLGALAEIQASDPAEHDKYKNAVTSLIGKMSERLV